MTHPNLYATLDDRPAAVTKYTYDTHTNTTTTMTMQLQQGDVWIESAPIPDGATPELGDTLAEGEHTGHAHCILEGDVQILAHEGLRYLRVRSDQATLTHEEHAPVTIPRGDYAFGQVYEYDYESQEDRYVID